MSIKIKIIAGGQSEVVGGGEKKYYAVPVVQEIADYFCSGFAHQKNARNGYF
jgi:hypothetical protein